MLKRDTGTSSVNKISCLMKEYSLEEPCGHPPMGDQVSVSVCFKSFPFLDIDTGGRIWHPRTHMPLAVDYLEYGIFNNYSMRAHWI